MQQKNPPMAEKLTKQHPRIAQLIEACTRHDASARMADVDVVKVLRELAEENSK